MGDSKRLTLSALSRAVLVTVHLKNQLMHLRTPSEASLVSDVQLVEEELRTTTLNTHVEELEDGEEDLVADIG